MKQIYDLVVLRATGALSIAMAILLIFSSWEMPRFLQIVSVLFIAWFGLMGRPTNE